MGVTDWGEINQPLGAPALGGAGGWADSVAKALNNSDQTVNSRVNALEAAMEALIDTAQGTADAADANADGRVAKTGDTMTGPLTLPDGYPAASTDYVDGHGQWVDFTPASTNANTFRAGTTGRYCLIGDTVDVVMYLLVNPPTVSDYRASYPPGMTVRTSNYLVYRPQILLQPTGVTDRYVGEGFLTPDGVLCRGVASNGLMTQVSGGFPATWTNEGLVYCQYRMEVN